MKAIAVLVVLALAVTVSAMDESKPKRASTLVAPKIVSEPPMHKRDIRYVPKGDPRARGPSAHSHSHSHAHRRMSRHRPHHHFNKQWVSPAMDLVPMLQMAPGAVCAPSATNIRAAAGTSAKVLFTTAAGEQLHVTGTKEVSANGYTWVPVSGRNLNGWVAKSLIGACPTAPATTNAKYPLFKQCGMSWSATAIGHCSPAPKTICQVGCAMSCVAMILKSRGVNTDPGQLNTWLDGNGGYSGCSLYWASVDKFGKTKCLGFVKYSFSQLCSAVASGKSVVLNVNGGAHWVLATGCDSNNNVVVNDPGYNKQTYPYSAVVNQVAYQ